MSAQHPLAALPFTCAASLPQTVTITAGQSIDLGRRFAGMTHHAVRYSYFTTTSGGTANANDIAGTSGNGAFSVVSSYFHNHTGGF